jgi:phenylacetate-CoA ligase
MVALGSELEHHIKSYIGVTAEVHVLKADKIARTVVGKAKRVIDRRSG